MSTVGQKRPPPGSSNGAAPGGPHQKKGSNANSGPPVDPLHVVQFKLVCPQERVGSVIGKGGDVVKAIREESGARLRVEELPNPNATERIITISSDDMPGASVCCAQDALMRVVARIVEVDSPRGVIIPEHVELYINILHAFAGAVIGKAGVAINEIKARSGAFVLVQPPSNRHPLALPEEDTVKISGNYDAVRRAVHLTSDKVRQAVGERKARAGIAPTAIPPPANKPPFGGPTGLGGPGPMPMAAQGQMQAMAMRAAPPPDMRGGGQTLQHPHQHPPPPQHYAAAAPPPLGSAMPVAAYHPGYPHSPHVVVGGAPLPQHPGAPAVVYMPHPAAVAQQAGFAVAPPPRPMANGPMVNGQMVARPPPPTVQMQQPRPMPPAALPGPPGGAPQPRPPPAAPAPQPAALVTPQQGQAAVAGTSDSLAPVSIQYRILLPNEKAGAMIGKGGETLRKFREETGASLLKVHPNVNNCNERVLECGSSEPANAPRCTAAEAFMACAQHLLRNDMSANGVSVRLLLSKEQLGGVSSAAGQLSAESGARVVVLGPGDTPACATPGDRVVMLEGKADAVLRAARAVTMHVRGHVVRSMRPTQPAGPPTPMGSALQPTPQPFSAPGGAVPAAYPGPPTVAANSITPMVRPGQQSLLSGGLPTYQPVSAKPEAPIPMASSGAAPGLAAGAVKMSISISQTVVPTLTNLNNIQQLRQMSGAVITLLDQPNAAGERDVELQGTMPQVTTAHSLIQQLLQAGAALQHQHHQVGGQPTLGHSLTLAPAQQPQQQVFMPQQQQLQHQQQPPPQQQPMASAYMQQQPPQPAYNGMYQQPQQQSMQPQTMQQQQPVQQQQGLQQQQPMPAHMQQQQAQGLQQAAKQQQQAVVSAAATTVGSGMPAATATAPTSAAQYQQQQSQQQPVASAAAPYGGQATPAAAGVPAVTAGSSYAEVQAAASLAFTQAQQRAAAAGYTIEQQQAAALAAYNQVAAAAGYQTAPMPDSTPSTAASGAAATTQAFSQQNGQQTAAQGQQVQQGQQSAAGAMLGGQSYDANAYALAMYGQTAQQGGYQQQSMAQQQQQQQPQQQYAGMPQQGGYSAAAALQSQQYAQTLAAQQQLQQQQGQYGGTSVQQGQVLQPQQYSQASAVQQPQGQYAQAGAGQTQGQTGVNAMQQQLAGGYGQVAAGAQQQLGQQQQGQGQYVQPGGAVSGQQQAQGMQQYTPQQMQQYQQYMQQQGQGQQQAQPGGALQYAAGNYQ